MVVGGAGAVAIEFRLAEERREPTMNVDARLPEIFEDVEACVEAILARVGRDVRIGVPLGLGKPVELVNALYARARRDSGIQLTILTALSLERPVPGEGLEGALMGPFLDRVFAGVPRLAYTEAQREGRLPANVRVVEFFFQPGSRLGDARAQRDYISTNYTFAARDVFGQGCNVAAQMVAKREGRGGLAGVRYSMSCNPDTSPELARMLRAAEAAGERKVAVVGLVNQTLPYMELDAETGPEMFDFVVDHPRYTTALFSTPKTPVATADHAIGMHASALLRDGGTLQIGIGSLGDALVHATILRHRDNEAYREVLGALGVLDAASAHHALIEGWGGLGPFTRGLYGASEMFVDGFLQLMRAGILKRRVYEMRALQELLDGGLDEAAAPSAALLDGLVARGAQFLRAEDFAALQHHGVFSDETGYEDGHLIAEGGARIPAYLADPEARRAIGERCLGAGLRRGVVLHGGFFLGPRDFYAALSAMSDEERRTICMTGVEKVNQLDLDPPLYEAQRIHARFVNTGMMATLSGAVVSDGLEDGRVISGVGGQYNFVAQAHQLSTGRSILLVRAVRQKEGSEATSNIVFSYGHCTIPRHLRDVVVTEYGIADLRGKTDSEVAKALLNVADARFQGALLEQAIRASKIEPGYKIPARHRDNTPERLARVLGPRAAMFPAFPFGSDFTAQELRLVRALQAVKARVRATPKWKLLPQALRQEEPSEPELRSDLERVGLGRAQGIEDRVARSLLIEALRGE
ncbi:Acetyl-CoA hydrolase [Chondromyces apiculatus DSM 436]|uniref:Acetyl-CoA hydrolase n=1 Tax=Chondromyces apiculatus DSM 436 TaxID=1192034 RepID=A0A017TET3_9BACT|nr:Acetyl-CoA hydrolase [Chondromyces apiculatus DSM 436]